MSSENEKKINHTNYFETKFLNEQEPWNYSSRAVEILRHEFILDLLKSFQPKYNKILEVGCALGRFTKQLYEIAGEIYAFDISITAVKKARERCSNMITEKYGDLEKKNRCFFFSASATAFPFHNNTFEIVLLCDGIISWELNKEQRAAALENAYNSVIEGGHVILTEYLHPNKFEQYLKEIEASPLEIKKVIYMNDRLAYRFETWFKVIENTTVYKKLIANKNFIKFLMSISSLSGKSGSKHICVIATKSKS